MSTELTAAKHNKLVKLFRIPDDVLVGMANLLDDVSKCRLIQCCKRFNSMKQRLTWTSQVSLFSILDVSYFHNFMNIIIPKTDKKLLSVSTIGSVSSVKIYDAVLPLPNNTIYLEINTSLKLNVGSKNKIIHLTLDNPKYDPVENYLFEGLTHIKLNSNCQGELFYIIPNTVTHLDLGSYFVGLLEGYLPKKLEYLRIGIHFKDRIEKKIINIPSSVKIEYIQAPLPNSVTHLMFGLIFESHFNPPIRPINIPVLD